MKIKLTRQAIKRLTDDSSITTETVFEADIGNPVMRSGEYIENIKNIRIGDSNFGVLAKYEDDGTQTYQIVEGAE